MKPTKEIDDATRELTETLNEVVNQAHAEDIKEVNIKALWADAFFMLQAISGAHPATPKVAIVGRDLNEDVVRYLETLVEKDESKAVFGERDAVSTDLPSINRTKQLLVRLRGAL